MEQNADMIVICDGCGEPDMLSRILGMDCKHMEIEILDGRRICKICSADLGEQPPVKKQ